MPRKGDRARQARAKVAEETFELAKQLANGIPEYVKTAIRKTVLLDDRSIPLGNESTGPDEAKKDAAYAAAASKDQLALKEAKTSAPVAVEVVNEDTLNAATKLNAEGLKPLILNMASDAVPGGGWLTGAGAQEEQLFYRTALCVDLGYCHQKQGGHPFDPERKWRYPLKPNAVIHSPSVAVLRSSEAEDYQKLKAKDRFLASFVSVAALRNPKLAAGGNAYAKDGDRDQMRSKIEAMFRMAIANGYDSMVLGAFGCGAFHNPSTAVAQLFKDAIAKYQTMVGFPKKIVFAVFDPKPDSASNFSVFAKAFENTQ